MAECNIRTFDLIQEGKLIFYVDTQPYCTCVPSWNCFFHCIEFCQNKADAEDSTSSWRHSQPPVERSTAAEAVANAPSPNPKPNPNPKTKAAEAVAEAWVAAAEAQIVAEQVVANLAEYSNE